MVTAADAAGNAGTASVTLRHGPGLLAGEAGDAAVAQVRDTDTAPRHPNSQIETTAAGQRVARGEIGVRIEPNATVTQVNAALASIGGTIAGAVSGSPQLAVKIPDPGSLAALEQVLAGLRARPGIERATLADMPATNELPTGFASPLSATGGAALGHLVALRMPAAWNARRAIRLADRPTLIVADMFGAGPLSSHVDAAYNSGALQNLTGANEHGYHVVGIAASRFSTNGTAAGNVTGAFPATTPLHVIEAIGSSTQMTGVRIVQEARARTGHVVVNTSLGWDVAPADAEAREGGSDWAQLVRGASGLEDRMLHAASAGNDAGPSSRNSRWSASPHRPHRRGGAADARVAQHALRREPRRDTLARLRAATRIPGTQFLDDDPTWSPDGTRIAFNGRGRTPAGIYVVPTAGGTPTLIPGTNGYQDPSWSPDGRLIAASTGGQQPDIVVFAPDGEDKLELTDNGTIEEYSPDWSPDATRIVFVSNRQIPGGTVTRTRIWLMDTDGSDVTQFTAPIGANVGTTVQDEHPSWSPDATTIAFARSHQNGSRFVMTKQRPEDLAVAVTPQPTDDADHTFDLPDWQPLPVDP